MQAGPRGRGRPAAADELVREPFDDDPHSTFAGLEADTDDDEEAPAAVELSDDEVQSADDPLGLYLRQMGSIPLLSRQEELALAQQLETARRRYRRAALSCWLVIRHVV